MVNIEELKSAHTNGGNYDVSNDDVIAKLQEWDATYGIETSDIDGASVTVHFKTVPDDTRALAEEVYTFCPDTVAQHFGCFAEMIEVAEEVDQDIDPGILELVEGVDLDADDYGLVLLAKSLKRDKVVGLWWD